jgi:hypothetical protein
LLFKKLDIDNEPHHQIQQIHNQVIQQQKHREMEKDMGGLAYDSI